MTNHIRATSPSVYGNGAAGNQSFSTNGYSAVSSGSVGGSVNFTLSAGENKILNIASSLHPAMKWQSDMSIIFAEEENGVWVKAKLASMYDLTPRESLAINLLITAMGQAGLYDMPKPLSYIRKHDLERHFDISLA